MTVQEYIEWLETRGPVGSWRFEDCRAADALVKEKTMENVEAWALSNINYVHAREFFLNCVRVHFGSLDVNEMLVKLGLYPGWME